MKQQEMEVLQTRWAVTKPIPPQLIKFTPYTIAVICENLSTGAGAMEAVQAAGVGYRTYKQWRAWAEDDPDSVFAEFVELTEIARAQAELDLLTIIKTASDNPKNWTAAAWLLERSRPERWSLANRVNHTGEIQHIVKFEFAKAKATDEDQDGDNND